MTEAWQPTVPCLMGDHELDVRPLRKPDKHPFIFGAYAAVPVGESLILVNDHDPRHLYDEFEVEYPGGFACQYLSTEPKDEAITAYLRKLAERTAAPGGGATAALNLAQAAALVARCPPVSVTARSTHRTPGRSTRPSPRRTG